MKYVYILRSTNNPERHCRKFAPWELACYFAFSDHGKADKFETYLKSGSGRAFAKRHL